MAAKPPRVACCWFRNDLRVHDNPCLARVAELLASKQCDVALPVYFFDPRYYRVTRYGNPKTGPFRAHFLLQSIADLKAQLKALNSDLLICIGRPEQILPDLLPPGSVVVTQEEVTSEELRVDDLVQKALQGKARLVKEWGATLYHRADLPFSASLSNMPDGFTPFKSQVENKCKVRPLIPTPAPGSLPLLPNLPNLDFLPTFSNLPFAAPVQPPEADSRTAFPFEGGETAALRRVQEYLFGTDHIARYFETRNGMLGPDYSTKFAPWLAAGSLSPRKIYHEIKAYEKARQSNKSTYWVVFELLWRDFFRFFALKHGNAIFFLKGTAGPSRAWADSPELLRRWQNGETGLPLVDANMRELKATGWMSNRGRQNVASYLALDLGLDWRQGADWFESLLLDYDVCSNWGNWVSAAGMTGGRVNHFNIAKQSKDYDENGAYARCWIPELAKVPRTRIHEPHLMSAAEQREFGVQIGTDYPVPPKTRPVDRGGKGKGGKGDRGDFSGGKSGPAPSAVRSGGKGWGRPY